MSLFYRCDFCDWIAEPDNVSDEEGNPLRCQRCGRHTWNPITDVIALLDAGVVEFCEACKRVHSR